MVEEIKEIEKETSLISREGFLSKLMKIGAGALAAPIVSNGMLKTASTVFAKGKNEARVKRKRGC